MPRSEAFGPTLSDQPLEQVLVLEKSIVEIGDEQRVNWKLECRKVEEVYNVSKTKKPSETQAPNANKATGSNYWKDNKMKGKKLNVNNPFDLFKKPETQKNFVDRGPPPKCKGCGKEHRGPCATGEVICYKCGRAGHYSRQCPQHEVRTMAVQATIIPVSVVPPMKESQTVGRVYTMDRQQSEKSPNLVK
ncbi:uncharacterized protein LOC133294612, partial [Gastrolobium bilobum]|uniref:uncharacterized protein LOC133294612 n=1 Tax=Gastrolobium bilobum TaxID=150636 RepID=UPI002AB00A80